MTDINSKEKKNVAAIIQARMDSNRLPGKVMKDIRGYPMLDWVITRAKSAEMVDSVMVATTIDASDNTVAEWCEKHRVPCFRGATLDVLDRFYQAATMIKADVVVRLTADCPLIDPNVIDDVIRLFFEKDADFCANRLPAPYHRTFPIGLDVEVVSFYALQRAWREAKQVFEREHVLPYLYAVDGRFKISILEAPQDYGQMRWTVDTPQDLAFIRRLIAEMQCDRDVSWLQILEYLEEHPALAEINASVQHKKFTDIDQRANRGQAH